MNSHFTLQMLVGIINQSLHAILDNGIGEHRFSW